MNCVCVGSHIWVSDGELWRRLLSRQQYLHFFRCEKPKKLVNIFFPGIVLAAMEFPLPASAVRAPFYGCMQQYTRLKSNIRQGIAIKLRIENFSQHENG